MFMYYQINLILVFFFFNLSHMLKRHATYWFHASYEHILLKMVTSFCFSWKIIILLNCKLTWIRMLFNVLSIESYKQDTHISRDINFSSVSFFPIIKMYAILMNCMWYILCLRLLLRKTWFSKIETLSM